MDTSQIAAAKVDNDGNEIPGTRVPNWPLPVGAERRPWCNACAGTGLAFKPSAEWAEHEGPSEEGLDNNEIKMAHQEWETRYRRLLNEHPHCLAIACELDPW